MILSECKMSIWREKQRPRRRKGGGTLVHDKHVFLHDVLFMRAKVSLHMKYHILSAFIYSSGLWGWLGPDNREASWRVDTTPQGVIQAIITPGGSQNAEVHFYQNVIHLPTLRKCLRFAGLAANLVFQSETTGADEQCPPKTWIPILHSTLRPLSITTTLEKR